MSIKLPDIPRNISQELYNYFIQLHLNIQQLEQQIAALQK